METVGYTYDLLGELLAASDGDTSYAYGYNVLGQVTSITMNLDGLTPTVVLTQQFNTNGNRTQVAATIGGTADYVTDYTYNSLGQVTSIAQHGVTGGTSVAEKLVNFAYDLTGDLSSVSRYANLLGTQLVTAATYDYDLAGRITELTYTKGATTLAGYTWTTNSKTT